MFKKLTEFGYKRTIWEAIGFYLAYLVLIFLTAAVAGAFLGAVLPAEKVLAYSNLAGITIAFVMCLGLSGLILTKKKLNSFGYLLFVVLSGILPLLIGALGGLIPVAFLTTRKPAKKPGKK